MFIAVLFIIARNWRKPRCSSSDEYMRQYGNLWCEQVTKMWYIYTRQYYLAVRKIEIMKFAGKWMGLGTIILSEVTQPKKTKVACFLLYAYVSVYVLHSEQPQRR